MGYDLSNCACCTTVACASNPERIPKALTGIVAYDNGTEHFLPMAWNSGTELWEFIGEESLCGNLEVVGIALQCTVNMGEFLITVAIHTTQLEQIGPLNWDLYALTDTNPFQILVKQNTLTGIGISGCLNNEGDIQVQIVA